MAAAVCGLGGCCRLCSASAMAVPACMKAGTWRSAPLLDWQREGEGEHNVCYRATGKEVLEYIHHMMDHELVELRTGTCYLSHQLIGEGRFVVDTSGGVVTTRALAFAPGAHETTAGAPHLPIEPLQLRNGACMRHSSGLRAVSGTFYAARKKYVVGASKAAIDIIETFDPVCHQERTACLHTRGA